MVSDVTLLGGTALELRAYAGPAGSPRVIAVHQPMCSTIAFHVVLPAGAKYDLADRAGLAHLAEHVLYSGGGPIAPGVARFDAAWTASDSMVHAFRCAPDRLDDAASAFARFQAEPPVSEIAVGGEREVVLRELQHRHERSPLSGSLAAALAHHFRGHAYARPASGTEAGVRRCTSDDVRTFVRERLRAAAEAVVICGDVASVDLGAVAARLATVPSPPPARDAAARAWAVTEPPAPSLGRFAHFVLDCPLRGDAASPAVDTLVSFLADPSLQYLAREIARLQAVPAVRVKRIARSERSAIVVSVQLTPRNDVEVVAKAVSGALARLPLAMARQRDLWSALERRRVRNLASKAMDHVATAFLAGSYASQTADPCGALAHAFGTARVDEIIDVARLVLEGAPQCYTPAA